jgi:hypothetical protein
MTCEPLATETSRSVLVPPNSTAIFTNPSVEWLAMDCTGEGALAHDVKGRHICVAMLRKRPSMALDNRRTWNLVDND